MSLTADLQERIVRAPYESGFSAFVEGPAGSGKTTLGVARLQHLLRQGVPGYSVLVFVPQRTLAMPYYEALRGSVAGGSAVTVATLGGVARRTIDLFWPLVAERAGFDGSRRPVFLTLETAQYHMDGVLDAFLAQRFFDGVTIRRNRLASQVLDNLNKAAVVGFELSEIAPRLRAAWPASPGTVYEQVQRCATAFRQHCLDNNLLDFSLQVEVFRRHLLSLDVPQRYLFGRYQHLIADNVEEDVPVAHDLVLRWLGDCQSALVLYDTAAGYRAFLGADPRSALRLRDACQMQVELGPSQVPSESLAQLGARLAPKLVDELALAMTDLSQALQFEVHRFHPQMLDWVAERVAQLVRADGVAPGQIAIMAPYLSDALRFSLEQKLAAYDVPTMSHRPSRALKEEPSSLCLLTLARLAHPHWGMVPAGFDVAQTLVMAIEGMDWVRAQQLTRIVYHSRIDSFGLSTFAQINPAMQERITYTLGGRYDDLLGWLERYREASTSMALDHFFMWLFADMLSKSGYGFHRDLDGARVAANLIESILKFRRAFGHGADEGEVGREYLRMVERGVVAAQYLGEWELGDDDAVLLAPAYTFLMRNQAVDYQFWLEVGSTGWWERPYQPLTHPYVLTRDWPVGRPWTDSDEFAARTLAMQRLVLGLIRRCRRGIVLGLSELGEQGYEQRGPLLDAFQRVLRQSIQEATDGR